MVYNPVSSALTSEAGLTNYIAQIQQFPLLKPEEEYKLALRYRRFDDREAAHKLVTSHLRLVVKVAMNYRGYGLPIGEVISEGNIGLMRAVKGFLPERGVRLATYALWWIKSSIHEYVLRSWSLVKIGTTAQQKRLFFNLRKVKSKICALEDGALNDAQTKKIAQQLQVPESEVTAMDQRLGGDYSLNVPLEVEGEAKQEWQDFLVDNSQNQEELLLEQDETLAKQRLLHAALEVLTPREKHILWARRLQEKPETLELLAAHYNISRERVRQIEQRAFEKLKKQIITTAYSS